MVMPRYSHAPSLEELLSQTEAEDRMTESASSSPTSVSPFNIKNFEAFLVRSHCDENYEFWKCCNYYLNHADEPTFDFVRWNTQIYENFIKVNSSMECNLPEDIREAYRKWYVESIIPSRAIVLKARQHTLNLMADAYRQFVRYVNTATPPPPSPAVSVGVETNYFAQQRDLKVRKNAADRKRADKLALKRSLTTSNATKSGVTSTSSSSTISSSTGTVDSEQSKGPLGLLSKGKALVTKIKRKAKKPVLKTASSAGSVLPVYPGPKRGARDTELDMN